jgi:hypothetical protein
MTEITVTTTLDSAALIALNTTPLELIATPGADKILVVNDAWVRFDVGATPMSIQGNSLLLVWSLDPGPIFYPAAYTANTDSTDAGPFSGSNNQVFSLTTESVGINNQCVNSGLLAQFDVAYDLTGITDLGTAIITIIYEEITA